MDVWVNGKKANTTVLYFLKIYLRKNFFKGEFLENGGTKTHFEIGPNQIAYIESESSGKRSVGLIHKLYINGNLIDPI